jgi:resolvase-like protein
LQATQCEGPTALRFVAFRSRTYDLPIVINAINPIRERAAKEGSYDSGGQPSLAALILGDGNCFRVSGKRPFFKQKEIGTKSKACRYRKSVRKFPMLVGYARVSTTDQNLALQRDALKAAGCRNVFTDHGIGLPC